MEPIEVDKLIADLEIAVDRLRSLYEQYFMGIERIEPMVARKDVDRKIQLLRKVQIRNTALRFRFQMILQRYNTYQTHWQRICREIENGTYKRHVARAQRRFGAEPGSKATSRPPPLPVEALAAAVPAAPPLDRLSAQLAGELAALEEDFAPAVRPSLPSTGLAPRVVHASGSEPRSAGPGERRPDAPPAIASPSPSARGVPPPLPPGATIAARPHLGGPAIRRIGTGPTAAAAAAAPARAGERVGPPPGPERGVTSPAAVTGSLPDTSAARPPVPEGAPVRGRVATLPGVASGASAPRDDLGEDRVRQLYAEFVETRRKQNESTATVTFEALARNLRESSARLRQKHGKPVDFEVLVRDGKTYLRPILK